MKKFILFLIMVVLTLNSIQSKDSELCKNVKTSGIVPEIFAPGIVSTGEFEFGGTFTKDGKEFYFTRRSSYQGSENRIYCSRLINGKWSKPVKPDFAEDVFEFEPTITPDGRRMYFYSERAGKKDKRAPGDIWFMDRSDKGWSSPVHFKSPVNKKYMMMLTSSLKGRLYFAGVFKRKRGVFTSSRETDYQDIEALPDEINSIDPAHPFIAPDESYIIVDSQIAGRCKPQLFISFRKSDGSWTKAVNMGKTINRTMTEFGATVSPDGKFLYFHRRVRGKGDIYRVSTKIIDSIKSEVLK